MAVELQSGTNSFTWSKWCLSHICTGKEKRWFRGNFCILLWLSNTQIFSQKMVTYFWNMDLFYMLYAYILSRFWVSVKLNLNRQTYSIVIFWYRLFPGMKSWTTTFLFHLRNTYFHYLFLRPFYLPESISGTLKNIFVVLLVFVPIFRWFVSCFANYEVRSRSIRLK